MNTIHKGDLANAIFGKQGDYEVRKSQTQIIKDIVELIDSNKLKTNAEFNEDYSKIDMAKDTMVYLRTMKDDYKYRDTMTQRINFNPYMLIQDAFNKVKRTMDYQTITTKVEKINPVTHEKTGEFVTPSTNYYHNKQFYNNLIKKNNASQVFMQKAGIGIYSKRGDRVSINFENFKQGIKHIEISVDGQIRTATVHAYKGKYGVIYIVEWISVGSIEILKENEFKNKYGKYM